MPHLHLPLQSGDDGVLRRMGRRYLSADYAATVGRVRDAIPGVAIHGDVIVGFPTEDDDGVAPLARLHPIDRLRRRSTSSATRRGPGTPAVRMAGQVDEPVRRSVARPSSSRSPPTRGRAGPAAASAGMRDVLFESRLDDGRWVGHAADHTLVAVDAGIATGRSRTSSAASGSSASTRSRRERVVGRLVDVVPPPAPLAAGGIDGR